ncbi:MAG: peptidylprolyl isomerase [Kiritimatiellae bacterium]|nr:peptidylprolyl isomerase [Kiritimatiellia bacterium]
MKKLLAISIVSVICGAASASVVIDGIAGKVNNMTITIDEVKAEIQRNPALRQKALKGDSSLVGEIYTNAVNSLIDRRLILNLAVEKKLDIQEWVIDNRVREVVKERFDGDMNKLHAMLAESRVPITEWRNSLREDMVISSMRYQLVDKYIDVSPSEMQKEYKEHKDDYKLNMKTSVSVILLRPSANDDTISSVATRADEIIGRLDNGEDFAKLAKQYSSDSKAQNGGKWENIDPKEVFRPEIADIIAKLKVGEHSPLVNLDGWGFIVRKDRDAETKEYTFLEAYEKIEANIRMRKSEEKYAEMNKRLRKNQYIEIFPLPSSK